MGFLEADRISRVDADGNQLSGDRASKTLVLHRRIYTSDPEAAFVIHTHSTHLVALTLAGVWSDDDILPPITPYYVMKVGHVPLIPYHRPGDPAVADLVAARIAQRADDAPIRAVMLDRLGPVVWGPNPAAAMAVLEELEETARLWMLTGRQPRTASIVGNPGAEGRLRRRLVVPPTHFTTDEEVRHVHSSLPFATPLASRPSSAKLCCASFRS